MYGGVLETVLTTLPRSSFDSLISEWDQAGVIWELASGLSTGDFPRFVQSRTTLKTLIASGVVRGPAHLVLVFPDVKVRLRLLRLFLETPSPEVRAELLAFAGQPQCDRRVAAAIRKGFPDTGARVVTAAKPSLV
jgi:hypothetical protein